MAEEAIYAIYLTMLRMELVVEAIWTLTQYDAYAREQDIENIRTGDLSFHRGSMAIALGVSVRGESSKTGSNQGVVIRRGLVTDLLLALREAAPEGGRVFPITQADFRRQWHTVCRHLGLEWAGPPHRLRHSGPSEDIARERTSLELVRRRGRWKSMQSVQRYSKTFALVKFRARMPPTTLAMGESIPHDLRAATVQALKAVQRPSALQKRVLERVVRAEGKDVQMDYSQVKVKNQRQRRGGRGGPRVTAAAHMNDEYEKCDPDEDLWMTE